jgi:hypothetical protein
MVTGEVPGAGTAELIERYALSPFLEAAFSKTSRSGCERFLSSPHLYSARVNEPTHRPSASALLGTEVRRDRKLLGSLFQRKSYTPHI